MKDLIPVGSLPEAKRLKVRIPDEERAEAYAQGMKESPTHVRTDGFFIRRRLEALLRRYGIDPAFPLTFQHEHFDCHWTVEGAALPERFAEGSPNPLEAKS